MNGKESDRKTALEYPSDWVELPLSKILVKRNETVDPSGNSGQKYVGLEHLESGVIKIKSWGEASQVRSQKSKFYPGDILYGKLRPYLDKAAVADWPGICSTDILVFHSGPEVDPLFAGFLMHSSNFRSYSISTMTGVHHPRTSWGSLKDFTVALPPIAEQRAIAHVLMTIQKAQEATDKVIAATKEFKKSLMKYLFTYGPVPIDEAEHVPLKETEIGTIPESWPICLFKDVVEIVRGQVDPKQEPYASMVHVGPENIESGTGKISGCSVARDIGLRSGKYYFSAGNVLYSKIRPYLRKAALPEFEGVCSADMYPLSPGGNIERGYLYAWLLSEGFTKQAVSYQSRTGIPKINRQQLGSTEIPVPTSAVQQTISEMNLAIDSKIRSEENRKASMEYLYKSMLGLLMTGEIRLKGLEV